MNPNHFLHQLNTAPQTNSQALKLHPRYITWAGPYPTPNPYGSVDMGKNENQKNYNKSK